MDREKIETVRQITVMLKPQGDTNFEHNLRKNKIQPVHVSNNQHSSISSKKYWIKLQQTR